jgi:cobalt-zinc-cadmium efflux system membrane fusion protein
MSMGRTRFSLPRSSGRAEKHERNLQGAPNTIATRISKEHLIGARCIRRRVWTFSALAAVAVLLACGKAVEPVRNLKAESKSETRAPQLRLGAAQKQFLTIESVSASEASNVLALPGRVTFAPKAQSAVGAPVAGRVSAVLVRTGERVKAGDPLLRIESADAAAARASLEQAGTRLAGAETVYQRNVTMLEKGVGLETEKQESEVRLKEARTEQRRAMQTVALLGPGSGGQVMVRAPSTGVVTQIKVAVGAIVSAGGEALLELGDPSLLQVIALVAESEASRVAAGQEAEIELPALSMRIPARVETIGPRVEAESRRMQVYLGPMKRVEGLQAGMLAQVALTAGSDAAIVVPVSAVLIKDGKRRVVYTEEGDGNFVARDVVLGRNRDGRVAVLKGLNPGDRVVVRGALLLDTQAELLL